MLKTNVMRDPSSLFVRDKCKLSEKFPNKQDQFETFAPQETAVAKAKQVPKIAKLAVIDPFIGVSIPRTYRLAGRLNRFRVKWPISGLGLVG